jgi:hypothetical protein
VTFVPSLPSFQAAVDIEFAVPFTHRLRFTHRIAEEDFSVLADLFTSDASARPKVLVVCESALLSEVEVIAGLGRRLSELHSIDLIRDTNGSSIHGMQSRTRNIVCDVSCNGCKTTTWTAAATS